LFFFLFLSYFKYYASSTSIFPKLDDLILFDWVFYAFGQFTTLLFVIFFFFLNACRIGSGSMILFNRCVVFEVQVSILLLRLIHCSYIFGSALCYFINLQDVRRYASFSDMLTAESLAKVLPGVETIEEGDNFYFIGFLCLFGDTIYAFRHRSRLLWSMARKMLHFTTVYMYISEI
jgi:hypothetical protein